jgi:hypothetical protein
MGRKAATTKDESVAEDVAEDSSSVKKSSSKKTSQQKGFNWAALGFLVLVVGAPLITVLLQVADYMYPEAAKDNRLRTLLVRCYTAANPSKLNEIESLVKKYSKHDYVLRAKLREKYENYPECQF